MKRWLIALALCLAPTLASAGEAPPMADDPELEQRVQKLSEELRCLVCQNESLAGSRAELANDLRREVRDLMKAGKSDKEIVDFLVQRYGDFVLYRPQLKSTTYLLWFGPFLLLAGGAAGFVFYLKRRRARVAAEEQPLSAEDHAKAEALLKGDTGGRP